LFIKAWSEIHFSKHIMILIYSRPRV